VEAGTTAVTPGTAVPVPVRVCNTGDTAMQVLVRFVGVEDAWTGPPLMVGPIEPGEETTVEFAIRIPVGFPPCDHLAGIEAEPIDPETGAPLGRAVFVEVVLEIGDGSVVRASLEPADIHGGGRAKFRVNLRNRGRHPVNVTLNGESPGNTLSVRFAEDEIVLPPGEFVRVKAKVKGSRHLLGPYRRLPFVVTIRSRGTPRHLDGSFTQSPTLKSGMMKVFALLAIVAMWGSILVIGLGKISPPKKSTTTQAAATESNTAGDAGGGDAGAAGTNGGAAGGGDSGGGSTAAAAPTGTNEIKIGGKVKGSDPSGATISLEPTSLVDEAAQGATFLNDSPSNALTMHYGHTGVSAPSLVASARTTTTDSDGAWAFGGIKAPGYYLIIISKPGFATKKFVVTAPDDGSPIVLDSELIAGDGTLGGTINGPDGPLGGVDLTITNGTITLKTLTPTTGDIGKWSVTGLSTPGTYLVMASRRGFGDETRLVDLGAGGSVTNADLTMHAGVGSVSGTVSSVDGPVGDVKVTVSDGQTDRSATTLTVDPAGTYTIPQLPIPGSYTLTVSGTGWITQTQSLDLDGNKVIDVSLTASNGTITGTVIDETTPLPVELDGVGITISNETLTLKTTSATGIVDVDHKGLYVQEAVPPGSYKVTFEKFGYITQSTVVDIAAGGLKNVDMSMPTAPAVTLDLTSKVSISVQDQADNHKLTPSLGPPVFDVNVSYTDEHTGPHNIPTIAGVAQFDQVTPGLRTFHVTASLYKPKDITVLVPPGFNEIPVSAIVLLQLNPTVTGILTDAHNNPITVPGMQVTATSVRDPNKTVLADSVDGDGRYSFTGTLDEGAWLLVAEGADYIPNAPVVINVGPTQTIEQPIPLHQLGKIFVTAQQRNQNGDLESANGVAVQISLGATVISSQTTSINGTVTFSGLAAETYAVDFPDFPSEATTAPVTIDTTTPVTILLRRLEVSVLTRTSAGGTVGLNGKTVTISKPSSLVVFASASTGADGIAFFNGLEAGNYDVRFPGASHQELLNVDVTDTNTVKVALILGRLEVSAQQRDAAGLAVDIGNVNVTITSTTLSPVVTRTVTTAATGPAAFNELDPDEYIVTFPGTSQKSLTASVNGNVATTGIVLGRLEVSAQRRDTSGLAVDIGNVNVTITSTTLSPVVTRTVTTPATGPAAFNGLDPDDYIVTFPGTSQKSLTASVNANLATTGIILGRVEVSAQKRDAAGLAVDIGNVNVTITSTTLNPAVSRNLTTPANGPAIFDGLDPDTYTITFPGTSMESLSAIVNANTSKLALILGRLEVSVQTLNANAAPIDIGGRVVTATLNGSNPVVTKTATTPSIASGGGPAVFAFLDEGTYTIAIEGSTQPLSVVVEDNTTQRTSLILGRVEVTVQTRDANGNLVDIGSVRVSLTRLGTTTVTADTPALAGPAVFTGVDEANDYVITFANSTQTLPADVTNNHITKVSLTLGRLEVSVQTRDAGGSLVDIGNVPVSITKGGTTIGPQNTPLTGAAIFSGLDAGDWVVTVTGASQTATVTVSNDLRRITVILGRLEVSVQGPNATGTAVDIGAVAVTVSQGTTVVRRGTTPTLLAGGGPAFFTGLDPGTYDITAAGTTDTITATVNGDSATRVAFLLPQGPTSPLQGTVVYTRNGVRTLVPTPTITVTGITGYTFRLTQTAPFFAFDIARGTAPAATFDGAGKFTVVTSAFKFSRGDIAIHADGFIDRPVAGGIDPQLTNQLLNVDKGDITLQALPATLSGAVFLHGRAGGSEQASQVLATVTSPLGTGVTLTVANNVDHPNPSPQFTDGVTASDTSLVSASAVFADTDIGKVVSGPGIPDSTTITSRTSNTTVVLSAATTATATGVTFNLENRFPDGFVHVNDPRTSGTDAILPGTYQFAFSLSSYGSVSTTALNFNAGDPLHFDVDMVKRGRLPILVQCAAGGGTPVTPASARVTLTRAATGFNQTLFGVQSVNNPLAFDGLPPTDPNTATDKYQVTAYAPGCQTSAAGGTGREFTMVTGQTATQTVTLLKLGSVSGRVKSKIVDTANAATANVPGLAVTITGHVAGNTAPLVLTTLADGTFSFAGTMANSADPSGDVPGLVDDRYTPTVDLTDYSLPTGVTAVPDFTVANGSADALADIMLIAKKASVSGIIHDGSATGNPPIGGVSVTATSPSLNQVRTMNSDATTGAWGFTGLEPVGWSFNFNKPNYGQLGFTITFTAGADLTQDVTLLQQRNTIRGTTKTRWGSATAAAENDVVVTVADVNTPNTTLFTATSATVSTVVGQYSISAVPNGSYFVRFNKAGFTQFEVQATVQNGQVLIQDGTISVNTVSTTVTVRSAVTNASGAVIPIVGTTVTLTPKVSPAQRAPDPYTAVTSATGVATFNQVLPSTYTIGITAVSPHLTALDVTEKTINVGDASASQTVLVQEARIYGRVLVQDGGTQPTAGTAGLTVNLYTGATASGTPVVLISTADTTENGNTINYLRYVAPSASGYTLTYPGGTGRKTPTEHTSGSSVDAGDTQDIGDTIVKGLTTLTITVHDATGATVTDATVEVTDETTNTSLGTKTGPTYVYSNLDPDHTYTIHASKIHPSTTSPPPPPTITIPGFTEGKTETGVTVTPGAVAHTITMTNPET
jgi:hypothetical protein